MPPDAHVPPKFSIVIPCYNEAAYLGETLRSLHAQTYTGAYEIIVVDNNCTDATADVARSLGARVVTQPHRGVCWARQRGTEASLGEIVISADADTTYAPDWLATIDRSFGSDDSIAAVTGPCRYVGGPAWGRIYARVLFGLVHMAYRCTGHTYYATATNIAFRKKYWSGYDLHLTQGGDELALLRDFRRQGRIVYNSANPTYTSSRRLTRGIVYGFFVTLLVYYLGAYVLNRLFHRSVIGSAPAYRDDRPRFVGKLEAATVAVFFGFLLLIVVSPSRHFIVNVSHTVVNAIKDEMSEQRG